VTHSNVIHPLCVGLFAGPVDQDNQSAGTATYVSAMFEYLILGSGVPILVDTGTLSEQSASERQHRVLHRPANMDPVRVLEPFGLTAGDIGIVVNTHLHWDHCSGNDRFPGARILVQRAEVAHAIDPLAEHRRFYDKISGITPAWLAAWDRVQAVDGDLRIAPGVTLIALPGHSPGSQGVLVETANGRFLIAGDNVNTYHDWINRQPPRVIVSEEAWNQSVRRIEMLECEVIPSHDLELVDHPPFGA
jgi:glyoxylase-like metal-dependent hydrolase (beta-lactamase superfamily II)